MIAAQTGAAILNNLLNGGKQIMICSEFVYRSYDEASDAIPDLYTLQVPGVAGLVAESTGARRHPVHPDSVLARIISRPDLFATVRVHESVTVADAATLEAMQRETERLLQLHVTEVESGRAPLPVNEALLTEPTDQEVTAAVTQFASAL